MELTELKLTGRTRYRRNWRFKKIKQVEVKLIDASEYVALSGPDYYLGWRDEKPTDAVKEKVDD